MKNILSSCPPLRVFRLPAIVFALTSLSGSICHAAVSVVPTVAFAGGVYTYSYTVNNTGTPYDLAIIDVPIGSSVVVTGATAPTGFVITSDGPPINLVSFLEDNDFSTPQTFAPGSSVKFFTYQSTSGPGTVIFSALDANGDNYTGTTLSAVPEPSGLLLLGFSALPLLAARRRSC